MSCDGSVDGRRTPPRSSSGPVENKLDSVPRFLMHVDHKNSNVCKEETFLLSVARTNKPTTSRLFSDQNKFDRRTIQHSDDSCFAILHFVISILPFIPTNYKYYHTVIASMNSEG